MQKKAIRIITNSEYNSHTAPLFIKLNILPFDKIIEYKKTLFMHKVIHKNEHCTFDNTWKYNANRETGHALRNNFDLLIPAPRFEGYKRFPPYDFAKTWNSIDDLKNLPDYTIFKHWIYNKLLPPPPHLLSTNLSKLMIILLHSYFYCIGGVVVLGFVKPTLSSRNDVSTRPLWDPRATTPSRGLITPALHFTFCKTLWPGGGTRICETYP